MLKNTKSKVKRMRGTSSHGWGHKKKHRGAGHRGGIGNAGTGARGDSKKPSILTTHGKAYYGKKGFHSIHAKKINTLSLTFVENNYSEMVETGLIVKDVLDTTKMGVDKVLGRGKLSHKLEVICNEISANAKSQIEAAGGKVTELKVKEESSEE